MAVLCFFLLTTKYTIHQADLQGGPLHTTVCPLRNKLPLKKQNSVTHNVSIIGLRILWLLY